MSVLVDTSHFYALLDEDDVNHRVAAQAWPRALDNERLVTHAYVVIETSALLQRSLGIAAAAHLHRALLPAVTEVAVDGRLHARAVERWLAAETRALSLVDVTSFVLMEDLGSVSALAFDRDFEAAGFSLWR